MEQGCESIERWRISVYPVLERWFGNVCGKARIHGSARMEHAPRRIRTFIWADTEQRILRMGRIAFLKRKAHAVAWTNKNNHL